MEKNLTYLSDAWLILAADKRRSSQTSNGFYLARLDGVQPSPGLILASILTSGVINACIITA
jgi:hypothetical protein